MSFSLRKFQFAFIFSSAAVFIIDQFTKLFAREIPINGIFLFTTKLFTVKLQYAKNPFIAFSLPMPWLVTVLFSISILLGLIYYIRKFWLSQQLLTCFALVIILSAAWSNFFDRLLQKNVIDFISIAIYNYNWPTFNIADALIVAGALLLLISLIKHKKV